MALGLAILASGLFLIMVVIMASIILADQNLRRRSEKVIIRVNRDVYKDLFSNWYRN